MSSVASDPKIILLTKDYEEQVLQFMEQVFHREQRVPKHYLPVTFPDQHVWGIINTNLIGLAIAWKEEELWHWGRFAIQPEWRGRGLGKMLAIQSLQFLFSMGISEIHIEARDITLLLLESIGGRKIGATYQFYGLPVTPMRISKKDFLNATKK